MLNEGIAHKANDRVIFVRTLVSFLFKSSNTKDTKVCTKDTKSHPLCALSFAFCASIAARAACHSASPHLRNS